jgi:hypothetical protein
MTSPNMEHIPVDLVPHILEQLDDRQDLRTSALVSWTFYRAATPLLYRSLDSRILETVGCSRVYSPPF